LADDASIGSVGPTARTQQRWIRTAETLVLCHRDAVTVVGRDGSGLRFAGDSADLVRIALELWSVPHTEEELVDHLRALAGECDPALVAETTRCLHGAGAIQPFTPRPTVPYPGVRARARVLLGVSGAIAATDAPALVRSLLARKLEVTVAMTASARRFVSAESLQAITHRPVYRSFRSQHEGAPAPHIQLAEWADLIVVYPATAATIARIAHGKCTDVLSATVTAARGQVLVVPSMNESMYLSGPVQRNLEHLRHDGRHVLLPGTGLEVATRPSARVPMLGPAPPPHQVVAAIEHLLKDVIAERSAPPASAEAWNRQYEEVATECLPWFTEELDADLATELRALGRGRLLDIGTGPGTAAVFAAQSGFDVVATDISAVALGLAQRRAGGLPIAWVLDDFVDSRLWGRFDVALDRGCLHCLPKSAWPRYARTMGRLVAPGGSLLLKVHAPEEGARYGTQPASADELAGVLGPEFSLVSARPSVFGGTVHPAPRANLVVLRRD